MQFSKEEVLGIITTQPNGNIEPKCFKKKFPKLYQEIINISFPEDFKWTQKLYHFFHDDLELKLGICPTCGKRCKFVTFGLGYKHHCSLKCTQSDKKVRNKIEETCFKRWGVKSNMLTDEFKEKRKQTWMETLGVDCQRRNRRCRRGGGTSC